MIDHTPLLGSVLLGALLLALTVGAQAGRPNPASVEANHVAEFTLISPKAYANPFVDVEVDAVVTPPTGAPLRVPAFWAGGNEWRFRYSSSLLGRHTFRTECSDHANAGLNGIEGHFDVVPNTDANPLYQHGPVRLAPDHRHFVYADGAPFFWLADTWWKCLCKRMTWEGFQELTADRKAKGFSVIQIVCGPYPDEGSFEPRWENEAGKPYETHDFSVVNPKYFEFADRRLLHLVAQGIVPAIVGGWGRGDCDGMALAGVDGMKRHWRNLIARYAAYPTVWIIGGESKGPLWTEVAAYVRKTDPFHRPATIHPDRSGRDSVTDESVIDFDMLQTGHGDWPAAFGAIPQLQAAYARKPAMPALIGEYCYEGHMQNAWQDVQRYVFWASMLTGAPGLTYGAAGVWNAGVEGDPGLANVYDFTPWQEGMHYAGSTQIGLGKKFLEQFPWQRFEPHPDWTEPGSFAAGIPGEVRFVYMPKRGVYNWTGPVVKGLERGMPYHAFYFDPARGTRFDLGKIVNAGPPVKPFEGHSQPLLFEDRFAGADVSAWHDYGTPTERAAGHLIAHKGMLSMVEGITAADAMASVEGSSDAEVGVVLRFHDHDHYLVALYTPLFKQIYLHDVKPGGFGPPLGVVSVPEIGPRLKLTAAVCGECAAIVMTDGTRTYFTPVVKVSNVEAGKTGLWMYQIGDKQEFGDFEVSRSKLPAPPVPAGEVTPWLEHDGACQAPNAPSPQDWVLVLERVRP